MNLYKIYGIILAACLLVGIIAECGLPKTQPKSVKKVVIDDKEFDAYYENFQNASDIACTKKELKTSYSMVKSVWNASLPFSINEINNDFLTDAYGNNLFPYEEVTQSITKNGLYLTYDTSLKNDKNAKSILDTYHTIIKEIYNKYEYYERESYLAVMIINYAFNSYLRPIHNNYANQTESLMLQTYEERWPGLFDTPWVINTTPSNKTISFALLNTSNIVDVVRTFGTKHLLDDSGFYYQQKYQDGKYYDGEFYRNIYGSETTFFSDSELRYISQDDNIIVFQTLDGEYNIWMDLPMRKTNLKRGEKVRVIYKASQADFECIAIQRQ